VASHSARQCCWPKGVPSGHSRCRRVLNCGKTSSKTVPDTALGVRHAWLKSDWFLRDQTGNRFGDRFVPKVLQNRLSAPHESLKANPQVMSRALQCSSQHSSLAPSQEMTCSDDPLPTRERSEGSVLEKRRSVMATGYLRTSGEYKETSSQLDPVKTGVLLLSDDGGLCLLSCDAGEGKSWHNPGTFLAQIWHRRFSSFVIL
jgi:hypothetical protein